MAARLMPNLMDTDDDRSARILSAFWGSAPAEGLAGTVLPLRPIARAVRHEMPASEENRP